MGESQGLFRESQRNSENRRIILENRRETRRIAGVILENRRKLGESQGFWTRWTGRTGQRRTDVKKKVKFYLSGRLQNART